MAYKTYAEYARLSKDANVRATLDAIAAAEGTLGRGKQDGYDVGYGYKEIDPLDAHPRTVTKAGGYSSSAAGRYQALTKTWDSVANAVGIKGFSKLDQDVFAIAVADAVRGALPEMLAGDIKGFAEKTNKEWASFPGSPYGQKTRSQSFMQSAFDTAKQKTSGFSTLPDLATAEPLGFWTGKTAIPTPSPGYSLPASVIPTARPGYVQAPPTQGFQNIISPSTAPRAAPVSPVQSQSLPNFSGIPSLPDAAGYDRQRGIAPTALTNSLSYSNPSSPNFTPSLPSIQQAPSVTGSFPSRPSFMPSIPDIPQAVPTVSTPIPAGMVEQYSMYQNPTAKAWYDEVPAPVPVITAPPKPEPRPTVEVLNPDNQAKRTGKFSPGNIFGGIFSRRGNRNAFQGLNDVDRAASIASAISAAIDPGAFRGRGGDLTKGRGIRTSSSGLGGSVTSGASSNFPGMDAAIDSRYGVTTVSDGNMAFTDRSDGASPGGTVLCTHYYDKGWLPREVYFSDAIYGMGVSDEVRAGYHKWAVPLVAKLKSYPMLELAIWPLVNIWAHSMHHPDKLWSKAMRWSGEGTCRLIAPTSPAVNKS